jgi:hypothetical protein
MRGVQAKEELERFTKRYYNLALEAKEVGVKGWNWGDTDVQGVWSCLGGDAELGLRMGVLTADLQARRWPFW